MSSALTEQSLEELAARVRYCSLYTGKVPVCCDREDYRALQRPAGGAKSLQGNDPCANEIREFRPLLGVQQCVQLAERRHHCLLESLDAFYA